MDASLVLAARGNILRAEAASGYAGNGSLADGCFAAAEAIPIRTNEDPEFSGQARMARLCGGRFVGRLHLVAYAMAHLVEAVRELPDLRHRVVLFTAEDNQVIMVQVTGERDLLDAIESAARWVEDTFELTGTETAAAVGSVEGVCASANACDTCRHRTLFAGKDPCCACLQAAAFGPQFSKWEPREEKK